MSKNIGYYFWPRLENQHEPAGFTVTKREKLPENEFQITEYSWGKISLWFLDLDVFTADERQEAYESFVKTKLSISKVS